MTHKPDPGEVNARLERLEDGQMFGDRRADELSEQMLALGRQIRELGDRVRRLESELGRLDEAVNKPSDASTSTDEDPGSTTG